MAKDTVEVLLEGGTATPGPPLGPAIGPFGALFFDVPDVRPRYFNSTKPTAQKQVYNCSVP